MWTIICNHVIISYLAQVTKLDHCKMTVMEVLVKPDNVVDEFSPDVSSVETL